MLLLERGTFGGIVIKPHCFLLFIFFTTTQVFGQRAPVVEDTIAGITVGKSTLRDVQRRFGSRLILDEGSRHAVRWDGECEVFFDLEKDDSNKPDNLVRNIQLLNLGKGADRKSPCNRVATGRGLRLSDSPERMLALYGPARQLTREGTNVAFYRSNPHCPKGSKKAVILWNMDVEWVPGVGGIHTIDIEVENTTCDELNSD
jgi:hypothetical protein